VCSRSSLSLLVSNLNLFPFLPVITLFFLPIRFNDFFSYSRIVVLQQKAISYRTSFAFYGMTPPNVAAHSMCT